MTNKDWVEQILDRLHEVRGRSPELRFGQLMAIIGTLAEDETGQSLWDVEDADFAAALERFAADMTRRGSGPAESGAASNGAGIATSMVTTPSSPRKVS